MGNTVESCIGCKRLFQYPGFGAKFCPSCKQRDLDNQHLVKQYIREHGMANMYEIAENTGVSENLVRQYLRDGMLEIPEGSPIYIKCESCGCDIRYGRWCPSCAARMSNDLKGCMVGVGEVPKSVGKMRFLNRDVKK